MVTQGCSAILTRIGPRSLVQFRGFARLGHVRLFRDPDQDRSEVPYAVPGLSKLGLAGSRRVVSAVLTSGLGLWTSTFVSALVLLWVIPRMLPVVLWSCRAFPQSWTRSVWGHSTQFRDRLRGRLRRSLLVTEIKSTRLPRTTDPLVVPNSDPPEDSIWLSHLVVICLGSLRSYLLSYLLDCSETLDLNGVVWHQILIV